MKYFIIGIGIAFCYKLFNSKPESNSHKREISEWSFQRYAKFYGVKALKDEQFTQKMEIISDLVLNKKVDDIKFIAKESKCTYEECILKIKYLKNKRKIGDLYIDHVEGKLKRCGAKEQQLLRKYSPYLYKRYLQIDEIARRMPTARAENLETIKEIVFKDLVYLDEKGLINGVILNKVDKTILYYHVEKHKKAKDYLSINCPSCGALNDVNRGGKARCEYCDTIISGVDKQDKEYL